MEELIYLDFLQFQGVTLRLQGILDPHWDTSVHFGVPQKVIQELGFVGYFIMTLIFFVPTILPKMDLVFVVLEIKKNRRTAEVRIRKISIG